MSLDQLPVNFFDVALAAILGLGIWRGRKHGMSEELMHLLKWLAVVIGCAYLYQPLGSAFAGFSPISLLSCYILAYIAIALVILALFAAFKRAFGGKLLGSDIFGGAEYYLGMGSGMLRFACILLVGLALLNARYYSRAEVKAMTDFQNDVYGSEYFPTLQTAQSVVFERSLTGPWIRDHFAMLLIHPTVPENKDLHQQQYDLPQ